MITPSLRDLLLLPPIVAFFMGFVFAYCIWLFFRSQATLEKMAATIGTENPAVARLVVGLLAFVLGGGFVGWVFVGVSDYQAGQRQPAADLLVSYVTWPLGALLGFLWPWLPKRFSVNVKGGARGCLVGVVFSSLAMLVISGIFNSWLQLISTETERILQVFVWLASIGLGGYWAARIERTTDWTSGLVVGLLAEFFVVSAHLKGRNMGLFLEMMNDPGAQWPRLAALALTLPAALLGGYKWVVRTKKRGQADPTGAVAPDDTNDNA